MLGVNRSVRGKYKLGVNRSVEVNINGWGK